MSWENRAQGLLDFIQESPTCYHAVNSVKKRLEEAGFVALCEKEDYELQPKGKY